MCKVILIGYFITNSNSKIGNTCATPVKICRKALSYINMSLLTRQTLSLN